MLVGEEHRVEPVNIGLKKLLAQVGRGIDQNPGDADAVSPFNQKRRPPSPVSGIVWIARTPTECGPRNASRGARAKHREARRHAARAQACADCLSSSAPTAGAGTLRNKRKKFSLVCWAIASGDTPRASARTLAVSAT